MVYGLSDIVVAIRAERIKRGLTQAELARSLALRQATVSRFERGGDVRLATLVQLARALEMEVVLVPRAVVPVVAAAAAAYGTSAVDPEDVDVYEDLP